MTSNVRLGDKFKIQIDKDGKVKVARDEAKIKAAKPVNARFTSNKPRVVSRRKALSSNP